MKNAWLLFKNDLKNIRNNTIALVIVAGLVVLPSIFSWYNLLACWDVFDNTGRLNVAVANSDDGYKSDLVPLRVNMGDQVVSALRANDDLHWVFTDEEDAIDGARSGRYYAAVVIPKDFSQNMMSFFSNDAKSGKLIYYSNEKINAIAPRLLDVGADQVSEEVNTIFEETLTEIAAGTSSALIDYANSADAHGRLGNVADRMQSISKQLDDSAIALDAYQAVFTASTTMIQNGNELIEQTGLSAQELESLIQASIDATDQALLALQSAMSQLDSSSANITDDLQTLLASTDLAFDQTANALQTAESSLRTLSNNAQNQGNTALANELSAAADSLRAAHDNTLLAKQTSHEHADDALNALGAAQEAYQTQLKPLLNELNATFSDAVITLKETTALFEELGQKLVYAGDSLIVGLDEGQSKLADASQKLRAGSDDLSSSGDKLSRALAAGDVQMLRDVIGSDPSSFSKHIAAPVTIERVAVYPVENFGSAMAPLYTTLALWIGALLIMVAIKMQPTPQTLSQLNDPTPRQVFFGRFGMVALISLMQSSLLSLGNLLFIGIQAAHPFLYVLCFWISGLVFTFIMYTLVALFANLGKALGVILLVVQISGGGGSYPLSLLPQAFQNVSPLLPVTHAVNAIRSAMFGVYQNDFWIQILALVAFVVPLLLLVFFLIRPLHRIVPRFIERIKKSKLM